MISIDEINKLQAQNKGLKEQNKQLQQDISILQGKLDAFQMSENEAKEIIAELKAKNERLKKEIKINLSRANDLNKELQLLPDENKKLKDELKHYKQIVKKISEVEK